MGLWNRMAVGVMGVVLVSGCVRTATRLTEMPRVDLNLEGGNRGYVIGAPPEMGQQKTTRQMIGTDIEIPSFYKAKHGGTPGALEGMAPPEMETDEGTAQGAASSGRFDTYVVQKGDSLWLIAAKPEIYGKASKWRRIFDANRELLKSPDRVKAGMTLKIPRGDDKGSGSETTYGDEGTTYKK